MVRAFIAVELPETIREPIRVCQAALAGSRARLTMVDPSIVHITIKFLGEVKEDGIARIAAALADVRLEPFGIEVGRPVLNNPRRPRIVWCEIADHGECGCLHQEIESVLSAIGFARDERPFRAHATIARVREPDPGLANVVSMLPQVPIGLCHVPGFALKKSTLTPRGPIYETIREVIW